MMPRKVLLGGLVAAILVGTYALVGFVFAPRWAASAYRDYVSQVLHLEPSLGELRINPFALSVEARGIAIREPGGAPLLACDRLYVNASIASLWHLGAVLDEVTLERPVVAATLRADGTLNLSKLAPPADPKAPAADPNAPLPLLRLGQLFVHGGELDVDDLAEQPALHARFAPIELRLHDFATRGSGSDSFEIRAVGPAGAQFTLNGRIAPRPFALEGSFGVEQMKAVALSGYAHDFLPFDMTAGMLRLATRYHVAATPAGLAVDVDLDALEGSDLGLQARSATSSDVHLASLKLADGSFSLAQRRLSLGSIALGGLDLTAVLGPKGLNLQQLFESGEPPPPAAAPAVAKPAVAGTAQAAGPAKPWVLELPLLAVHDSRVHFLDRTAPQPAPMELQSIELEARGYSSKPGTHVAVTLAAQVGDAGHFNTQLDVQPDAPALKGKVALAGFDLRSIQPYLADRWRLDLQAGEAAFDGQLQVSPGARPAAPPRISFDGAASVRGLRTTDRLERKDFIRWQQVKLEGLRYRSEPAQLRMRTLVLDAPYVDLVIAPNGSTNISDVLASKASAASLVADGGADDGSAAAVFGGEAAPAPQAEPATPAAPEPVPPAPTGPAVAATPAAAAPRAPNAGLPLAMSIDVVQVNGASANFEDYSIKPNFATGLQDLKGTIKGLSSEPDSRAALNLDGAVDKYAPTHIAGEINILSAQSYANIKASFRNMDLTALSPYSGKFAGYQIERGKLSVEVSYLVQNRKLDAKHKILLTQLQLGDKVDSPDATSLPLKLVVALLKDADGNIDLDIPVTGDLDDPRFRVGPIIWKMVVNLCRKIATAPFALLGKLFGGGEDMQFIDFAPGSSAVDAPMQERIGNLRKALKARGGLSLEIPPGSDAELDGAALLDAAWTQRLESIAPAATRTNRAAYQRKLEKAYTEAAGKPLPEAAPAAPVAPAAPTTAAAAPAATPPADAAREARIAALEAALKAKLVVDPAAFDALGQARARAIQDALLQPGEIDPLRVFIVAPAPSRASAGKVRVALSMRT
jgi:hypothetical protein